jgi:hypothetical protein
MPGETSHAVLVACKFALSMKAMKAFGRWVARCDSTIEDHALRQPTPRSLVSENSNYSVQVLLLRCGKPPART